MDIISEVCRLLEERKELFLQYEEITVEMLDCPTEEAEQHMARRAELAVQIDENIEQASSVCGDAPDRRIILDAAGGNVEFAKVPSEYQCVFYSGQGVRSVVSRIMESEKQVRVRLEKLRDEAREHLKQHQDVPVLKKYLVDLGEKPTGGMLTDEKV